MGLTAGEHFWRRRVRPSASSLTIGKIAETIRLGRRTMGIIRFNIGFALALKAVFLVLTLFGHASLWLAVMADTGATLLVVANALTTGLAELPSMFEATMNLPSPGLKFTSSPPPT